MLTPERKAALFAEAEQRWLPALSSLWQTLTVVFHQPGLFSWERFAGAILQSGDLTQGLHRVSLLEVAALQRGDVLEGVPDHQLQLVQTVLLESDVNRPSSHPALCENAGSQRSPDLCFAWS